MTDQISADAATVRSYRLLAVDDEEAILGLYREILAPDEGPDDDLDLEPLLPRFELSLCGQGEQAVEAVRQAMSEGRPFSVAILDVRMPPGQDGVWTAERIRELDPDIEIVIVSAYSDVDTRELNRRVTPPDKLLYIQKPLHPEELRQLAKSLCAKWKTARDLITLNATLQKQVDMRTNALSEANKRLKRDMSVRMRMLQELLESEERYRLLFEEDITGDFVAAPDGTLKACNKAFARIFGFGTVQDAMSVNIFDLQLVGADESLHELILSRKKLENFEAVFQRLDLRLVHVIGTIIGILNVRGQIVEIRGYLLDITERKRLEEQLRIAQKMEAIGTLAGGIAHDFNNILGVITGYAEIILESTDKGSTLERRLKEILGACRRAKDLINQILNFSRQGSREKKALRVSPLIKETVKLLRTSLPASIEIRQNIMTANDTVMADPSQVHQILLNLCTNAAHAMRERGGMLEISLAEVHLDEGTVAKSPGLSAGAYVVITVTDTGYGISKSIQEKIFDPFFTTKKPGDGTGMGLAVVHGIVKQHGGVVYVQSEEGKGAAFQVLLPQTGLMDEAASDEEELGLPMGEGRILFVDDEMALVDIGREMLESLGYEVVARTSSVEALEAFRFQPDKFELILTDQNMPNLTGMELAEKALQVRPDVPIILCTGFSEIVSYSKVRDLGIKEIIMKPILKRQLAESLHKALASRGVARA